MQPKMQRFLLSIGIEEFEEYDLDFILVGRAVDQPSRVDMAIRKTEPWSYDYLDRFLLALGNINYPYSIRFSYDQEPQPEEMGSFFSLWYLGRYNGMPPFEIDAKEGEVCFVYTSGAQAEEYRGVEREFASLLRFITYPFSVTHRIETPQNADIQEEKEGLLPGSIPQEEPEVVLEKPQSQPVETFEEVQDEVVKETISEEPLSVAESAPAESVASEEEEERYNGEEEIAKDREEMMEAAQQTLLSQEEINLQRMIEERNAKRVWTRGDYRPVDHIDGIYALVDCNVDFCGTVFSADVRNTRKGTKVGVFGIGDETNAINVRIFESKAFTGQQMDKLAKGTYVRIRGALDKDRFTGAKTVIGHYLDLLPPPTMRDDPEEEKRVELHLHTKMSVMDGVADFESYYKLAAHMGMEAIAITDHGVVQNFPAAQNARKALKGKYKGTDKVAPKIIYGMEAYMFDLQQKYIENPCDQELKSARYCVFDTETTGLSARYDRLVEFGGVLVERGRVIKRLDFLINPEIDLDYAKEALAINKIDPAELAKAKTFRELMPEILEFLGDNILVAHNAMFDIGFLNAALEREGHEPISNPIIDTIPVSHYLFPEAGRHNEGAFLKNLGLNIYNEADAHRADYDAEKLNDGWQEAIIRLDKEYPGITHRQLNDLVLPRGNAETDDEATFKKKEERFNSFCHHLREYHATILVKNQEGLKDLYQIVTEGHTTYLFHSMPKTPRSLIQEHRANLLIGSACFNGEIFDMALTRNLEATAQAMAFYDFIEIQPIENYSYLLNMGRVQSKDHLIEVLKDIIAAAKIAGKPVVATGDCHYVNPEDKIIRDVYIAAKAKGGGAHPMNPPGRARRPRFENPDQHFRSTREMLDSFEAWLDPDEARKIVVTNSRYIASLIDEDITPVSDKVFAPDENLPHSDQKIRELCESHFHERYDYTYDDDPKVKENVAWVWDRLQRELDGIIGNGYAVTYYIAHCLIKLAADEPEHYIVGSRGSVGSSFAATMADITEVNALPAHYHCPHCHYLEFADSKVYKSGFDLPDKPCPKCGTMMHGDGQNIPFETFLGFHAEKVPDIDLNFEEDSQHKAHNYTKDLLGEKNVFRAGTIEKVAEKTAFGFVRGYFESIGKNPDEMNNNYIAYLAYRCEGVKRTTGQHPGGIVVIPSNMSVYDFTAVQHPADDLESEWLTTHYDFRSMHDEVLKLDILGHVDPMAMRYYRDLTGVVIEDIPMNDPRVLSLFTSEKELGLARNFLGLKTGALALPEFGTPTCQRMLDTASPTCFNDLLIISGLAHGTNVWAGNAEELVKAGKTLNEVIGCRDDIMTYLISMGVDPSMSFRIMEDVRKGKGLKPEYEQAMMANHVPDFYIDSCKKIAYLFPRGHATAYVTMAVRVAYFKLYYPLEFYAVFFSIRSDDWDIVTMVKGEDAVNAKITELRARQRDRTNPLSNKEAAILDTLTVACEMLERGYHFEQIDLYRSEAKMFVVDHERKALIAPFVVVDGLGLSAAESVIAARKEKDEHGNPKPFLSKEDLLSRTKLNGTNIKKLEELGVLDGMGETNQISLFEFL